jgi:NAD(P)-dependent dehydrogenase (short-subunit alcohol dehydrogenase family)
MTIELTKTCLSGSTASASMVTGAGRGIGLAAVSALADAGRHVTLAARRKRSRKRPTQFACAGNRPRPHLDVRDVEAVKKRSQHKSRSTSWCGGTTGRRRSSM